MQEPQENSERIEAMHPTASDSNGSQNVTERHTTVLTFDLKFIKLFIKRHFSFFIIFLKKQFFHFSGFKNLVLLS